jgi:hypothetical protein
MRYFSKASRCNLLAYLCARVETDFCFTLSGHLC